MKEVWGVRSDSNPVRDGAESFMLLGIKKWLGH